ncbi:quinone-dependent dihydroorotate dehydrogenase [Williamsia sp. CHRR-6]|uniref:quinone-dependent dihydroorotate dehydrogenase n=1 Tax=Williamsia sp. CHRR-6 TaxID=2835871 RepID=UPI001BDAF487|nr:quinone-dependent dihydroorotate dehydrogenase [Williamsia sp. CHRR-6]MBT0568094.1 quinone-dependent dihydroorotate dehydrogenase [Williamsia sp. CHRR-6]
MIKRINDVVYPLVLRLMFRVPAERIHTIVSWLLATVGSSRPVAAVLRPVFARHDPILASTVFGVRFPAPLGLAAGFDKNAEAVNAWGPIGFGFAEIGTVTGHPQPGNPTPRLFRLPADRALINRMGFNNHGAGAAAAKLATRRMGAAAIPIGANIGKTKIVEAADAVADYLTSARLLGPLADFVVVNVSSPNTPGLRDLQAVAALRPLLSAVLDAVSVPVLVKIAPDLSDSDIDEIADLAVELGLAGIVCTNTTITREGLHTAPDTVAQIGPGGLSGAPLAARSLEVLRRLHDRVGDRQVLISVGGIETAEQAWERICAGASLIQGYTGFIYGGPMWVKDINDGIAARLRSHGFSSLAEAVGSEVSGRRRPEAS